MSNFSREISSVVVLILWFSGIVAVSGFWWTILAIIPPFGLYFGVELFLKFFGVL